MQMPGTLTGGRTQPGLSRHDRSAMVSNPHSGASSMAEIGSSGAAVNDTTPLSTRMAEGGDGGNENLQRRAEQAPNLQAVKAVSEALFEDSSAFSHHVRRSRACACACACVFACARARA